jgi:hypothetical protein
MNQKVVIYIILSAILLYLYYKRGDLAIFAAFAVVAGATLIFRSATIGEEGFGFGGGGGGKGDKGCAKMGFTAPKIDKNNIKGSLDKILKNFKKVVEKYADVGERGFDVEKSKKEFEAISQVISSNSAKDIVTKWQKEGGNDFGIFIRYSYDTYNPYIFRPSEKEQTEIIKNLPKEKIKEIINGGNRFVKMLEDIKKLDETKELDKKANAFLDAFICAFKQSVLIWKSLDKAMGSGGGDDKDDDEGGEGDEGDEDEKPKKKKKKSTKKKSKKVDDDDDE